MRVIIRPARGYEKCRDCGLLFKEDNSFQCETHERIPQKVLIRVQGKGNRDEFYEDLDGDPLTLLKAAVLKKRIQKEIDRGTYNSKKYEKRSKRLYLFKNYKEKYLDKMRWRARLTPGQDGWLARSSLEDIEKAHRNYLIHFDEMDISDISTPIIKDFIDELTVKDPNDKEKEKKKSASNHLKKKLVGHMRHMLGWAHMRGDLTALPAMPKVTVHRKKKRGLAEKQQEEILKKIPVEDWSICAWLVETGRRINEARAMKYRDIDFKRDAYRIGGAFDCEVYKPFPKKEDHVDDEYGLTDRMREILKVALNNRPDLGPDSFVFVRKSGQGKLIPYTDFALRKIYNKVRTKLGYDATLNVFGRHSKGWQLREQGFGYDDIADILGNTPEVARANYSHMQAARRAEILSLPTMNSKRDSSTVSLKKEKH